MEDAPEVTPVRSAHRIDESALEGGQSNPTFHLTVGGKPYVMRKKLPGEILPSAHQVQRE